MNVAGVTALLWAIIALLVTLVGGSGLVALAFRPTWRKALWNFVNTRSFSVAGVAVAPGTQVLSLPPGSEPALARLPQDLAVATPQVVPLVVEERKQEHWFSLLQQGQYVEGVRLLREEAAKEDNPEKRNDLTASGLFLAFNEGYQEAAEQLRIVVETNPDCSQGRHVLALVLARTGKADQAEVELREALKRATSEEQKVTVLRSFASLLVGWDRKDRSSEAIRLLTGELGGIKGPKPRADLYVAIAEVYLDAKPPAVEEGMLALELALRETPTDKKLRFDVAYKYGEYSAPGLAFFHYNTLLEREPTATTLNNTGVAAEALNLAMTAVHYYRAAQDKGETLAVSNLASRLMTAGFRQEAEDLLKSVLSGERVHSRVYSILDQLASSREAEEKKRSELIKTIGRVRKWRLRYAEAILADPIDAKILAGQYAGAPSLKLDVDEEGKVSGAFDLLASVAGLSASPATLTGRVRGKALAFSWRVREPGLFAPRPSSGSGVLIPTGQTLSGFRMGSERTFVVTEAGDFAEWELTVKAPS